MRNRTFPSRRRFLGITALGGVAAGVGGALLPWAALATSPPPLHRWRGITMGADAAITLAHPDAAWARACLDSVQAEISRLEDIFSLFREDSCLSRLNREGRLAAPPPEMIRLMVKAKTFGDATGGAFDVTVQPLWSLYRNHFGRGDRDPAGPGQADADSARHLVDYRKLHVGPELISFRTPGMAATLNGIAQGFITDHIAALLKAKGFETVLLNLGETMGLGGHPGGRPWRMGILDPHRATAIHRKVELRDRAMATSGGYGTPFGPTGRHHHLFDPRTGASPNHFASVTVLAPDATTADALSTAIAVLPEDRAGKCLETMENCQAYVIREDGAGAFL